MKVAILGYGVEGKAAYEYWRGLGHEVDIFDDQPVDAPEGARLEVGPDWQLDGYDLIVRSPGVRPDRIPRDLAVTSVTRAFLATCPVPIIGVTGTKGKGTTTTLIARILEAAGKRVHTGGNISRPALELLSEIKPDDLVVLELSSFQLIDATKSPAIAVCLMIVPEHLNWHADLDEYVQAKGNIFRFQKAGNLAVYNAQSPSSTEIAQLSKGTRLPYLDKAGAYVENGQIKFQDQVICATSEVGLIGPHNLENVCAAVAATSGLASTSQQAEAIRAFRGLEHRLELVGERGGVRYYDDSFSTVPETSIAAIRSFQEPKVLILGGSDKKSDYSELAKVVAESNVRKVIAIGAMAEAIETELKNHDFTAITKGVTDMTQIVAAARAAAQAGDVVLLSPACASFGMFKDYKDRGQQFKQAVVQLT